ncbi:MAG: YlxR family protein [Ilumatobacteraceae bacterium]|nr:YlxR family protein [Ilumatobacteraceae bacterium]
MGCRTRRPQGELARCVIDPTGTVGVSRTAPGRGAWICGPECLEAARRSRGFERAWRRELAEGVLEPLAELLERWRRPDVVRESDDEVRD